MLNVCTLMGRLTRDPEMRQTQTGKNVASFSIACDRDVGGETDFIDIVVWEKTAEFVCNYFKRGSMIAVTGRLQSRKWTGKDGNNRTDREIVADRVWFAGGKREEQKFDPLPDETEIPF